MIRAVAWDIDGTLVDSEGLHHVALIEVSARHGVSIAPDVHAAHPAFDVTPARYITAIITERGVARPAFTTTLPSSHRLIDRRWLDETTRCPTRT